MSGWTATSLPRIGDDAVLTAGDIAEFIKADPELYRLLLTVETMNLPDGWVAAGTIRNAVWDHLQGNSIKSFPPGSDVDVVYLDSDATSRMRDALVQAELRRIAPGIPWEVRNQARMHVRNGDRPYRSTADAMGFWPETATAIGARAHEGKVEILAPLGIEDLLNMKVRINPAFAHKTQACRARVKDKGWTARWPNLRLEEV
jgi:hypothetical protein